MTKQEHIAYWLTTAKRDVDSMNNLLLSKEYQWSLFVGHLAIEKLLKAFWVRNNDELTPPRTHNLLVIAAQSKLTLSEEERELLADVNEFNMESRYPDYKQSFYKKSSREFASSYVSRIKDLFDGYARILE